MGTNRVRTLFAAIGGSLLLGMGGCTTMQDASQYRAPDYRPAPPAPRAQTGQPAPDAGKSVASAAAEDRVQAKIDPATGQTSLSGTSTSAGADLLQRIRDGFALDFAHYDRRVEREYNWFAGHQDYLLRCIERARPYLHHITESLEARGMPLELALLPIVESAFNPYAYSPSHAAGVWQFISSTGRNYGLQQNDWYDGRRDVLASTRAALDYLQKLEQQFEGDWLLALAAYNSGEGRVARVARANIRNGRPADFWHLDLPRETEAYVPKLLAVARLFAESPDWLPQLPDEPYFDVVDHEHQVALQDVARLAGIDMEEMYHLNPGYARWATPPEGPHYFLVPRQRAEQLRSGLASLPKRKPVREFSHRVRAGDTLSEIAARYDTDTASLRRLNNLQGSMIRVGQELTVHSLQPALADGTLVAMNNPHVRVRAKRVPRSRTTYTVRSGDNLWSIARRYRIGVRELAAWNGMHVNTTLHPGKKLRIRQVDTAASVASTGQRKLQYRVRGGDSLWTIARAHRVSVADIRRWNAIGGSFLKPGQTLTLFLNR